VVCTKKTWILILKYSWIFDTKLLLWYLDIIVDTITDTMADLYMRLNTCLNPGPLQYEARALALSHHLRNMLILIFKCRILESRMQRMGKSAMGPHCREYCLILSLVVCPWPDPFFFSKRWMMPRHKNLGPIIQTLGMYNWTKNLCLGSTKIYLVITRHKLIGQLGSQGKKRCRLKDPWSI
jgi:hypothetical protein